MNRGFPVHREAGVEIVIAGVPHGIGLIRSRKEVRDRIRLLKISERRGLRRGIAPYGSEEVGVSFKRAETARCNPAGSRGVREKHLRQNPEIKKKFFRQLGFTRWYKLRDTLQVLATPFPLLLHPKAREEMQSVAEYDYGKLGDARKEIEELTAENSRIARTRMKAIVAGKKWLSKKEEKNIFVNDQFIGTFRSFLFAKRIAAALPKAAQEGKRIILLCGSGHAHEVLAFLQDKRLSERYWKSLVPPLNRMHQDAAKKFASL